MKRILYCLFTSVLLALCSCDRQDDTYRQFIVPGGYNYPAKPLDVRTRSGYLKVEISWAVSLDPAVKSAKIYWDSRRDSVDVDYSTAVGGRVTKVIDKLEDRSYSFDIVNFDDKGNGSLPLEVTVSPYGDGWLSTHAERRVAFAEMEGTDAIITMGNPMGEMVSTKFRYRNSTGNLVELEQTLSADEYIIVLPDAKKGSIFEFQSSYVPEYGLDVVWSGNWIKSSVPISYSFDISRSTASVTDNQVRSPYVPKLAIDGIRDSDDSKWMSSDNPEYQKEFPKIFVVDTKESGDDVMTFTRFKFYQNPDPAKMTQRRINLVFVYVGDTPFNVNAGKNYSTSFGTPVLTAILNQNDIVQSFSPKENFSGRYVAVVFANSFDTTSGYLDLYEFEAFGYASKLID